MMGDKFYAKPIPKRRRRNPKLKRVLKDPNNANGTMIYHAINGHRGIYNFCGHCRQELNKNTLRWE